MSRPEKNTYPLVHISPLARLKVVYPATERRNLAPDKPSWLRMVGEFVVHETVFCPWNGTQITRDEIVQKLRIVSLFFAILLAGLNQPRRIALCDSVLQRVIRNSEHQRDDRNEHPSRSHFPP